MRFFRAASRAPRRAARGASPDTAAAGPGGRAGSKPGRAAGARDGVRVLAAVCDRIAAGDLDERVPYLGEDADLQTVRAAVNHVLDVTDAFIREAQASLAAASEERFERAFLVQGMPGRFRTAAEQIDRARLTMAEAARHEAEIRQRQQRMADTASDAAQVVAAAAVQLSASADALTSTTRQAVEQTEAASHVVEGLRRSSEGIQESLRVITQVTGQTKMLALNATIEAVRAGEAGRAFAVVAGEVKQLADQTAEANARILERVDASRETALGAIATITQISALIQDMDVQVAEIARAASGGPGIEGLAQMAERLHTDTGSLAETTGWPGATD